MECLTLQTPSLEAAFDRASGALVSLTSRLTGWRIFDRPELGLSWRMLLPLSETCRNNNVWGGAQRLTRVDVLPQKLVFLWDGVVSERGGAHDIRVWMTVAVRDDGLVFSVEIDNQSPYWVENVYCPCLGDIRSPRGAPWLRTFSPNYASAQQFTLWPSFPYTQGYYGTDVPTCLHWQSHNTGTPTAPFCLLRGPGEGLYLGAHAPGAEYVGWMAELLPGYDTAMDAHVPRERTIAGKPVHTRVSVVHVPYIAPGERRALSPVALAAFCGTWTRGADLYKAWRDTWFVPARPPLWAREPHAWQQLHINSPEDELRMRYVDLPKVAAVCKKHGVKAIQLVGWNDGGQDQGNPSHSTDPRLGTFEELREAIAACRAMGVRVVLFTKFTWADRASAWYRDALRPLAIRDPYGDEYVYEGYRYQTATQLLNVNTKRLVPMCFLSEAYMRVCEREFEKVVALGADGMLFDESQHHSPALFCFAEEHGHRYGAPVFGNDRGFIHRLRGLTGGRDDFLMAGEACYDAEMDAYQLSYFRSESSDYIPLSRYLQPRMQCMTAVCGFNDRNMVNQCLQYRFIISYEPYNFKGSLDDFPQTMAYGSQMDALRTSLRAWFWDGTYRHHDGARVTDADGAAWDAYAVYEAQDASLGLVAVNYGEEPRTLRVQMDARDAACRWRLVDDEQWQALGGGIILPAWSAAVIVPGV